MPNFTHKCKGSNIYLDSSSQFACDVLMGLTARNKFLQSKYFYDNAGSLLFQKIMALPEYYLTKSEEEIFSKQREKIFSVFSYNAESINLIELGAGDGSKTKILLQYFASKNYTHKYTAIDISKKALLILGNILKSILPDLSIKLIHEEYFKGLLHEGTIANEKRVLLFLGSNIGNFLLKDSIEFLQNVRGKLNVGDQIMIGFDLKKSSNVVLDAYNDTEGITSAFNLNLLTRINRELNANFNLDNFSHKPSYNSNTGEAKSFIESKISQTVFIENLDIEIQFLKDELIHTEISRKYDLNEISIMAKQSGFRVIDNLLDEKEYFCDSIWEAC